MAVDTEKTVVLNIDAQSGIKSMRDLKQAIKDGKDQLASLTAGTEEYNQVLSQTAELQHQYREINEQVNRSTMDFGQTLSNVNSVMAGGVAAIQGVTAGLSLMGVDMGDDDKLTQNLVKSMSLLQAMSKMDAAVKGFKALAVAIKANITAAGGLGKALKALAVSNPFTAILAGITAVIAAAAVLINMFNEAKQAEEALKDATIFDEIDSSMKEMEWSFEEMHRRMKLEGKSAYEIMEADQKALLKRINELEAESIRLYKRLEDASKDRRESIQAEIDKVDQLKQKYMEQREYNTRMRDIMYEEDQRRQKEEAEKQANAAKQAANARAQAAQAARQKLEQQQANAYKHELSLLKQTNAELLHEEEMRYHDEQVLYENNAVKLEEAELEHQKRTTEINNKYLQEQITLAQQRLEILNKQNKDNSKQGDIDAINEQIAEMTRQIELNTQAYNDNERAVEKNRIAREIAVKQALESGASQQKIYDAMNETQEVLMQHDRNWNETLAERSDVLEILGLGYAQYYEDQMEYERELIELEEQRKQIEAEGSDIELQMQQLQEQFDAKLITEEEYNTQRLELQQAYLENKQALDENEVQSEKLKLDRKKQLNQAYSNAIKSITGQLTSLLNSLADAEGVSFEDSKKMKIAAATISTIQGGIDAFMGYLSSGIPQPYASILGGVAAAATVAMGMIEIQKIKNTKPGTSNASAPAVSNAALATMTSQTPQIVNLNAMNDEIDLPDQRVYVVESDITDAQRRVEVVENNSTI